MAPLIYGLRSGHVHRVVYRGRNIRVPAIWATMEFSALAISVRSYGSNGRNTCLLFPLVINFPAHQSAFPVATFVLVHYDRCVDRDRHSSRDKRV